MKINGVTFKTTKIEAMKRFYTEVLEMPLIYSNDDCFTVKAGDTSLTFKKGSTVPFYHICIRTNSHYFEEIFNKLEVEQILLPDDQGKTKMDWEGKQAYFTDPEGNILEIIEREYIGAGHPDKWYDISEVGLPVEDIKETQIHLENYINDSLKRKNQTFAFFGDVHGYLVLVKKGRHWFPTNQESSISEIEIEVFGKTEGEFRLLDYPYYFKVLKGV